MRRAILVVLLLVLFAAAAWAMRGRLHPGGATQAQHAGGGDGAAERPVPVLAATVVQQDVPVYLEGLGNAAAYYTVTVRPLVDGPLAQVQFREGQFVTHGTVLAQIDPRPFEIQLAQAEGLLARDRGQLHASERLLERDAQLRTGHYIAPQDYDTQLGLVEQYRGAVHADEAQVANARLLLQYAQITAPIDGVTGVRLIDPGNVVHAADPNGLVVITQLDPIAVFFTLPEDDLVSVAREEAQRTLAVEVFARDGTTRLGVGQLELIDNQVNATTATIRLKAIVKNPDRLLWPQQFVKVRLLLATRQGALVIPAPAVQRGPNGPFVYVIGADGRVASRAVTVEQANGDLSIVTMGLTVGERVVTDGQTHLRPGSRVIVRPLAATEGGPDAGAMNGSPAAPSAGHGGHGAHGEHRR